MASDSSNDGGKPSSISGQDNTPPLIVVRSQSTQQAFVAKALETLELLGQREHRVSDANSIMYAGFQIEAEATEQGFRVIASTARSLSTHAAELYLQSHSALATSAIKGTVDLLSVLLLRVYLTGTDVDSSGHSFNRRPVTRPAKTTPDCLH